jgi:hypothetical protein
VTLVRRTTTLAVGLTALALAGCGSSGDEPTTTTGAGTTTGRTATRTTTSAGDPTTSTATTGTASTTGAPAADGDQVTSRSFRTAVPAGWVDSTAAARKRLNASTLANVTFSAYAEKDPTPPRANVSFREGLLGGTERGLTARGLADLTRKQFETEPSYDVRPGLTGATVDGEDGWIFQATSDASRADGGTFRATIRQLVVLHDGRYVQVTLTTGAGADDDGEPLMAAIVAAWHWDG